MRALSVVAAFVLALLACSSSDAPEAKPFSSGNGSSSPSSGDDDDDDIDAGPRPVDVEPDAAAPPAPPAEEASPFRGILSATPTVKFGGAPNCSYDVTMRNIEMELTLTPSGSVIGGTAKNNMVERLVGACASPALGTMAQTFNLATVNGLELTFAGRGGPKTKLVAKLKKAGASWEAALTYERLDAATPTLKWVVKTTITLGPK